MCRYEQGKTEGEESTTTQKASSPSHQTPMLIAKMDGVNQGNLPLISGTYKIVPLGILEMEKIAKMDRPREKLFLFYDVNNDPFQFSGDCKEMIG